jgi:hypothetical protein
LDLRLGGRSQQSDTNSRRQKNITEANLRFHAGLDPTYLRGVDQEICFALPPSAVEQFGGLRDGAFVAQRGGSNQAWSGKGC